MIAAERRNHWANHVMRHGFQIPDSPALRWQGTTITWGDLAEQVRGTADAFAERGLGFGDRLALLTFNRPEFLVATFAATRLGAIVVPINFRLTPGEIGYVLDDASPAIVVADAHLVASLPDDVTARVIVTASPDGTGPDGAEAWESLEATAHHDPADVPEDSPALIMYTSGTTGRPKGAVLTHVNLQGQALSSIRFWRMFGDDEVYLLGTPLFHIGGIGSIISTMLLGGVTVIVPTGLFDAAETLRLIETERVTGTFLVPAQWQLLCNEPSVRERDLSALRNVCWGAAPATDGLLRQMSATFPDANVTAVFGQTEMSPVTCQLGAEDAIRKLGSVGKPIPTIAWRVVDDEMNDVPQGDVGEIVYRGPTQMLEYWNKPDETAEAFAGGWFHSGDLVRVDEDGFVYVVDRKKDMIITGGENVYCAEVENVLSEHPAVAEISVIGRPDERWGEAAVAIVVLTPGSALELDELRDWASERLARYKLPSDLVVVPELPRNASGKVVKGVLRDQFGKP
jgi:fatty-acyl-CoA synthase